MIRRLKVCLLTAVCSGLVALTGGQAFGLGHGLVGGSSGCCPPAPCAAAPCGRARPCKPSKSGFRPTSIRPSRSTRSK